MARRAEFGDFQTPVTLARRVCQQLLDRRRLVPASVVEPTCGVGNFLFAALDRFSAVSRGLAVEINPTYISAVNDALRARPDAEKVRVLEASFFQTDWRTLFRELPEPILVIGNPPWVTNATLGVLESSNLPVKSNFQNHRGLDAMTGKSNFDISEWMLIKLLEALEGRQATLAMLCKTVVARKVLVHAWKHSLNVKDAEIHRIDAIREFGAAVDACLLVGDLSPRAVYEGIADIGGAQCPPPLTPPSQGGELNVPPFGKGGLGGVGLPAIARSSTPRFSHPRTFECRIYTHLGKNTVSGLIGYHDGRLLADRAAYERWKHLEGNTRATWRSGVKHDCMKVMEFLKEGRLYRNRLGELVELEDDYLFPMLKGSELARGDAQHKNRWMLIPQRKVGDDTALLQAHAPRTWAYLESHAPALDRRASSIYRKQPRFAVFGVGEYTFSPWKVAISGFAKELRFCSLGSVEDKPIVLDDTAYFASCHTEEDAVRLARHLNSEPAREFYTAFLFRDAKRPVTVDLLQRLDLSALAREVEGTAETPRPAVHSSLIDLSGSPSQRTPG